MNKMTEEQMFGTFLYHEFDQSINRHEFMLYWIMDVGKQNITKFKCGTWNGDICGGKGVYTKPCVSLEF
nr:unnamed protein product [Spirometra erinaceieuropaei]